MRALCLFCGSSAGVRPEYLRAARTVGTWLAERKITLVYGGGQVGMMWAAADAALAEGGKVIGVIPQALVDRELAHRGVTELRVVGSMHERKALMAALADGFLALPGGIGTFEELFEVLTWSQLGLHGKTCAVLNVAGYYDPLLALVDHAVAEGFLSRRNRRRLLAGKDARRLLERLERGTK